MQSSMHDLIVLSGLRCVHLRCSFKALNPTQFYQSLSPTLRGAVGWALREISCVRGCSELAQRDRRKVQKNCKVPYCPYAKTFLSYGWPTSISRVHPATYRIITPYVDGRSDIHASESFTFDLWLFGKNYNYSTYWILAFLKAGLKGIGESKSRLQLETVDEVFHQTRLWDIEASYHPQLAPYWQLSDVIQDLGEQSPSDESSYIIEIHWQTPYIFKEITSVDHPMSLYQLAKAIIRRVHALFCAFEKNHPIFYEKETLQSYTQSEIICSHLSNSEQIRYSHNHKKNLRLDGIYGKVTYRLMSSYLRWIYYLLQIGELIGVGSQTMMGFGSYRMYLFHEDEYRCQSCEEEFWIIEEDPT